MYTNESISKFPKVGSYEEFKRKIGDKQWYILGDSPYFFDPVGDVWENLYMPFVLGRINAIGDSFTKVDAVFNVRVASIMAQNGFTRP